MIRRLNVAIVVCIVSLVCSVFPSFATSENSKCGKLNSIIKEGTIRYKCLKVKGALRWKILKNDQVIVFTSLPPSNLLVTSGVTNLDFKSSSGLPLSILSKSPNTCSVNGLELTPKLAGNCSLLISQIGDKYFNPATLQFSINIFKAPQNILSREVLPTSLPVSKRSHVLSFVSDSGLMVSTTSKTSNVCSVEGFDLKLLSAGSCEIVASQPGNESFLPAQKSFSILLTKASQTISVTVPREVSFPSLAEEPLKMKVSPTSSSGLPVVVSTTTPSVCTVDGLSVLPISAGECVLKFEQKGDVEISPAETVQRTVNFKPECSASSRNTGNGPFLTATCYVGTRSIASPWFGPPSSKSKIYEYVGGSRVEMSVFKNSMIFDYYNGCWVEKGPLQFSNIGWAGRQSSAGCTIYSVSPSGVKVCQTGSGFDTAVITESNPGLRKYCAKSSLTASYCSWEFDVNWISTDPNIVPIANIASSGTSTSPNPSPTPTPAPSNSQKSTLSVGEKMQKLLSALDKSIYRIQCTVNRDGSADSYLTNAFAADVTLSENTKSRGFYGSLFTSYQELSDCLDANVREIKTFQAGNTSSGYIASYDNYNDVVLVLTRFPVAPILPSPTKPQVGDFVMHLAILGSATSVSIYGGYVSNIEGINVGTDLRMVIPGGVLINEDGKWIGIAQSDGEFQKPGLVCRKIVICDVIEDINRWSN